MFWENEEMLTSSWESKNKTEILNSVGEINYTPIKFKKNKKSGTCDQHKAFLE